ncbi:hypothetical protein GE061_008977 [Apolygus lucorum]|uniref:Uncharacterized protein n=1 Tax=Apolygus lucorum TaxID=248454 RepID=A0A6A4KGH9_APOLU|nr:hypothetical protein GE061_008977 [Apolygus lucorum]
MISYSLSDKGSFDPSSPFLAAAISSGFNESVGSRLVDDIDLVRMSGSPQCFLFACDFTAFDSHCVAENFRRPLVEGLLEVHEPYSDVIFGRKLSEYVLLGYGPGRISGTYWNSGRRVVRINRNLLPASLVVEDRRLPSLDIPASVLVTTQDLSQYEDKDGDALAVSVDGSDLFVLTSHGSGELTTLLFNSFENLSIVNFSVQEILRKFVSLLTVEYRRVVGDDSILVGRFRGDFDQFDGIIGTFIQCVQKIGHVINPDKLINGFGYCKYRQTHCLRGVYIPANRLGYIQSEKVRFVSDAKQLSSSLRAVFMTKISRGSNVRLASWLYIYILLQKITIITKRFSFSDDGRLLYAPDVETSGLLVTSGSRAETVHSQLLTYAYGLSSGRLNRTGNRYQRIISSHLTLSDTRIRQFLIPHVVVFSFPASLNGLGCDPMSFMFPSVESEMRRIETVWTHFGYAEIFLFCLWN